MSRGTRNHRQRQTPALGQDIQMGGARPRDNESPSNTNQQRHGDQSQNAQCHIHPNHKHTNVECRQQKQKSEGNSRDQNPRKNDNRQSHGGRRTNIKDETCTCCGMTGHFAQICRQNPIASTEIGRTQDFPQNIEPSTAEQPVPQLYTSLVYQGVPNWKPAGKGLSKLALISYCAYCNVANSHGTNDCLNQENMCQFLCAKIICRLCKVRGHTDDDCNNPVFRKCSTCHRRGHDFEECRNTPDTSAVARLQHHADKMKESALGASRFRWNGSFALTKAQKMKLIWEQYHAAKQEKCEFIPEQVRLDAEAQIRDAEQNDRTFAGLLASCGPQRPNCCHANIQNNATPHTNDIAVTMTDMRTASMSHNQVPAAARFPSSQAPQQEEDSLADLIRRKCNHSCCPSSHANDYIRAMAMQAVHGTQIVSGGQMDAVATVMQHGGNFFRDGRAMEALFARKRPCCMACRHHGSILNAGLNEIPDRITTGQILNLSEWNDWGLFVGFSCRCSVTMHISGPRPNYDWESLPQSAFSDWQDDV